MRSIHPTLQDANTMKNIINEAARVTGVEVEKILNLEEKSDEVTIVRHMVSYLAHYGQKLPVRSIQNYFGFAQHGSVINGINRISGFMGIYPDVSSQINLINRNLHDNAITAS